MFNWPCSCISGDMKQLWNPLFGVFRYACTVNNNNNDRLPAVGLVGTSPEEWEGLIVHPITLLTYHLNQRCQTGRSSHSQTKLKTCRIKLSLQVHWTLYVNHGDQAHSVNQWCRSMTMQATIQMLSKGTSNSVVAYALVFLQERNIFYTKCGVYIHVRKGRESARGNCAQGQLESLLVVLYDGAFVWRLRSCIHTHTHILFKTNTVSVICDVCNS